MLIVASLDVTVKGVNVIYNSSDSLGSTMKFVMLTENSGRSI